MNLNYIYCLTDRTARIKCNKRERERERERERLLGAFDSSIKSEQM